MDRTTGRKATASLAACCSDSAMIAARPNSGTGQLGAGLIRPSRRGEPANGDPALAEAAVVPAPDLTRLAAPRP